MNNETKNKSYDTIDLVKFIFAIIVVSLHLFTYAFADMASDGAPPTGNSNPVLLFLMPLYFTVARAAVPFFFIASSYFLFKKIKNNPENRKEIVKNYCLRILKLYAFWLIVSLPVTVDKYFFNPVSKISGALDGVILFFVIVGTGGGVRRFMVFNCFNPCRTACE